MSLLLSDFFNRLMRRSEAPPPEPALEPIDEPSDQRQRLRWSVDETALLEWVDEQDQSRAETVHVVDRSPAGMGVRLRDALEPGWPVLITPQGEPPVKAIVRHSRCDAAGWFIGLLLVHRDRRRFDRRPVDVAATLSWQAPAKAQCQEDVRIIDAGEGGVKLLVDTPVDVETAVCVTHEGWRRYGAVVYCRREVGRYAAGIQFCGPPRPAYDFDYRE